MRTVLKHIATGLLCLALLIPCACKPETPTPPSQPVETPTVSPSPEVTPPVEPAEPVVPPPTPEPPADPDPEHPPTGDTPALHPDREVVLPYELYGVPDTIPAVLHHTLHGYSIIYDAMHYESRSYHEVDSYWSDVGLYLSVSIVYGMPMDYVLDGLQLQENIEMAAELVYIGSGSYPAYTLYTVQDGIYRQFWALDYLEDTMLIEQSYPLDHEYVDFHQAVQAAMLRTLTLDYTEPSVPSGTHAPQAYITALENLYYHYTMPDGTTQFIDQYSHISDNRFAVYDIDNDGKDELIIEFTSTMTAGMVLLIYDYDGETDSLCLQLQEFPNAQFYSNGAIEVGISHNQGISGAFWPYALYIYDAATDSYTSTGLISGWDKYVKEADFPDHIDVDGDGIVYYLPTDPNTPVDAEEYFRWRSAYVGDAETLWLPFVHLTEDNINALK